MVGSLDPTNSSKYQRRFCGFARNWDEDCDHARYICTVPGPYFETNQGEPINVVWINQLGEVDESYEEFLTNDTGTEVRCYYTN